MEDWSIRKLVLVEGGDDDGDDQRTVSGWSFGVTDDGGAAAQD